MKDRDRVPKVYAQIEREMPDFVKAANGEVEIILMSSDAFSCSDSELQLLGTAIKYAAMHGKDVTIVASDHDKKLGKEVVSTDNGLS